MSENTVEIPQEVVDLYNTDGVVAATHRLAEHLNTDPKTAYEHLIKHLAALAEAHWSGTSDK